MLLVHDKGTAKKPDPWLLCSEDFTDDELAPYADLLTRLGIRVMAEGESVRWSRLQAKETILAQLAALASDDPKVARPGASGVPRACYRCAHWQHTDPDIGICLAVKQASADPAAGQAIIGVGRSTTAIVTLITHALFGCFLWQPGKDRP